MASLENDIKGLDLAFESDSDSDIEINVTVNQPVPAVKEDNSEILRKYADRINTDELSFKKGKVSKDKSDRATVEQVLDPRTMGFLAKIINTGVIDRINGCISTGKEANVYHGNSDTSDEEYAVKIYKTSILVFKDREKYVDGEYRFRNNKGQSNPRKMVKQWAEKEFRNLKRLYSHGIPCPKPVILKSHVLAMEYLTKGEGQPSPKLRDHKFRDVEEVVHYYHQMLFYMRRMYQECQLVHADLSEYNSIVHKDKLYIIDVSQSVAPDHKMSLEFLRTDIKNVNDFFSRKKINVYPERFIFKYIVEEGSKLNVENNSDEELRKHLETLPLKEENEIDEEDEVFRSIHLVRSLNNLEERDFEKFSQGKVETLTELVESKAAPKSQNTESDSEESSSEDDDSDDEESSGGEEGEGKEWVEREVVLRGKKYEDKDEKKARKLAMKDSKKEKRKTKMKKHVKKKLVKKKASSK